MSSNLKRQISEDDGQKLADEMAALFFEGSAKTGDNVKNIFTKLAYSLPGLGNEDQNTPDKSKLKLHFCVYHFVH
jgi:hypothetical protein